MPLHILVYEYEKALLSGYEGRAFCFLILALLLNPVGGVFDDEEDPEA